MRQEFLEVNGRKFLVKILYEDRAEPRASIGKTAIHIRIPLSLSREEQFRELLKMKVWVRQTLEENPERFQPKAQKEYKDGDVLKVGEDEYKLQVEFRDKQSSSARISRNCIHLVISSNLSKERQNKHISTLLSRCVARKRLPMLKEKIHKLNEQHLSQPVNKIFFKNLSSRWGSCSDRGNINISTRLLFAPNDVLEYVCIHELSHLIEHNHSDRFWALVEKAMPNYKEKQQWLKENGGSCAF
ncbi:MAG TPA: SprT family zinc-dependent metalloprotease [Candidatus Nanoarchaeia archaeon]|nr:SprT family zinc-dependent metalloprotease [Candidatus Nanoarchaeia archaeon]